jgi:aminotransferase
MKGVISLGIGEPDFVTPWQIREAAIYSLEKGYTMYTSNEGLLQLREDLSSYIESQSGLTYDPDCEILITTGTSEALDLAMRAIINSGDEIIIPDPCYVAYPACTVLAGGTAVMVPTFEKNNFVMKVNDIEQKITPRTKAVILGNPANPTGATYSLKDQRQIAELAQKYNIIVFADEIYGQLVYNTEPTCFAALPGMKQRTILFNGFSKSHAMTGWRIGYAAASKEIIGAMTKIHQYTMLCAPIMAQMAAIEALKLGTEETRSMVREYDRRRRLMVKGLREIGLSCFEPQGAFYTFPSIKNTGMTSEEFAEKLLLEEKVAVVPGSAFGSYGEGYIRCCYATSSHEIEVALKRMGKFLKRHH